MLGVCYYPEHWPEDWWADDARRMRDLGITYVRIAEFAWSRFEPRRGQFDWGWLDRAIDVLGKAGLKVVMCTPTGTPPVWLCEEFPDILPVDESGRIRGFGARKHYRFASERYIEEARRITEIVAMRYGGNPHVAGWQTDNEYGCHDTILSYAEEDRRAFSRWLRRRYQNPEQLNEAWGNAFWSMDLNEFEQVPLPKRAVTESNPALSLDYWRFASEQVLAFDRMQVEFIRAHSPGRFVTHNFMGLFLEFDHWPFGGHLDLASWDSYPIGFTERFPFTTEEKVRWGEVSHPDMAAFHHDLYRGVGRGRWWVMEQQPGPVNWAPWNAVPKPGMVRLWTWQALAHGAECVSYFRWRQAPFAQEQFHAGLNLPNNAGLSPGGEEAAQVGRELKELGDLPATTQAPVALVFDYETSWMSRIQPQGQDFNYLELCFRWYEAVRKAGLDVDILPPGAPLAGYRLVLCPSLMHVGDDALRAFKAADGMVMYGPRTGSKTRHQSIPLSLPPDALQELIPMRIIEVSSLRPGITHALWGRFAGQATRWREHIVAGNEAAILAQFKDGGPAALRHRNHIYLGFWADGGLLDAVMDFVFRETKLKRLALPEGVRLRRRGDLTFAVNFGEETWAIPASAKRVLGERRLPPQGVAVWR